MMRNYKSHGPGDGAKHQLMTGPPMTTPLTSVNVSHQGVSMESVHGLATDDGDTQAALSAGAHGVLRAAGRP